MADDLAPHPRILQFLAEAAARLRRNDYPSDQRVKLVLAYIPAHRSATRNKCTDIMAVRCFGDEASHVEIAFVDDRVFNMGNNTYLSFAARTGDYVDNGWLSWMGGTFCCARRRRMRSGPFIEPRTFNRDAETVPGSSCCCYHGEPDVIDCEVGMYEYLAFNVSPRQADLLFVAATGPSGYHPADSTEPYADGLLHPADFNDWGGWWATVPGLHSRSDVYNKAFCSQFVHHALVMGEIASDPLVFGPEIPLHELPSGLVTPPVIVRAFMQAQSYGTVQAALSPANPSSGTRAFAGSLGPSRFRSVGAPALGP